MLISLISRFWNRYKLSTASMEDHIKELRKQGIVIGIGCEIYKDVTWGSEPYLISIGNHVRITSGVRFVTHDGGVWTLRERGGCEDIDKFGRIRIGNNVHIGWNTIIMPNVEIGDNCVIGCGAVVTKNVPPNSVSVGVPAKVIMTLDEYYKKNMDSFLNTKTMSAQEKREYLKQNLDKEHIYERNKG